MYTCPTISGYLSGTIGGGSSGDEAVRGVLEATNGQGADVMIVATGSLPAIADAISMCRPGATLPGTQRGL
jgi:threonine dehydrogenase-like Zn-dependent dehydrogenase